ncbi:SdrD B-like domain-containing protein, partial [Pontixanthobacter sp.]|uniref:SdrD B-like domain-containing protein n=1 Tax=Pontixanthobacter sp. TaxID=2792078 RepID=UPI003C7CCAEF
ATITSPAVPVRPGAPVPVLDPATGLLDVPAGTPAGTYTISYEVCETLNPANCAVSTVTVEVTAPDIVAERDIADPIRSGIGAADAINIFDNDTVNGTPVAAADVTVRIVTPASNAGVVLDTATGVVSVAPEVPAGTYTIEYEICEVVNPANCATSTVTIVVEPSLSSLSGTVYTDVNGDGTLDGGDTRLPNWIVEVRRNGELIAVVRSDDQGNYVFNDLLSGGGYEIAFRNPNSNVIFDIIQNVTLADNTTVVDQNLPIDPSGIFYDSIARTPIAGVLTTLVDRNGNALPAACYLDPSQNNQTTGADGEYRFDIVPGAAAQCPSGETEYRIVITPPAGFSALSTVIAPQTGPFDPTGLAAPVRINPDPTIPTISSPPYYLDFRLASGDPDVIFNHIPLDPFLTRTPLIVSKTSFKRSASVGDIVPYEITVRNTENAQRSGVNIIDLLPPGMKYVLGTGVVDGVPQEPVVENRQAVWSGQVIPANGSVSYNLTLVIGAGVTGGEKVNTGLARSGIDGAAISNRGTAVVSVVPSAVFDCSEVIGKVFEDANRNGYQDAGEPGVPGVRLATVNGQLITTDQFGRYHIACAAVPDARIGSNYVLKVDTRTLPLGWDTTSDNPRSIRLTRGKFGELNFGVAPNIQEKGE